MKKYRAVQPHTKQEAETAFVQGTSAEITDALLGVTYYVEDWRWVQTACLALLDRSDTQIQWTAIQCLGHLATFHRMLDLAIVLPALQTHASDPKLAPVLSDAFSDIAVIIKEHTSLVENWDELPQGLREALIEEGVFDRSGKRIKKRNFAPLQKNEALG